MIRIKQVFGRGLGVFDKNIEVAILIKDPGVEQFVLEFISTASTDSFRSGLRTGNSPCGYLYKYFMYEWVGVLSR